MDDQSLWLTPKQQRVWRDWLAVSAQLPVALHRRLQADSGLSLQDFAVLVYLTDNDDGRVRISQLAKALSWERSRFSHHYKRMESRGLITREECPDDARGAFIVLTPAGRDAIERAAPGHARVVRDLVFDSLSDEELEVVAGFTRKVLDRLASSESSDAAATAQP